MADSTDPLPSKERPSVGNLRTLEARGLFVNVVEGPDKGRWARLDSSLRVGTSPDAGLQLTDSTVSRAHVELVLGEDGTLKVRDLQSRNGTFVAGVRVQEASLEEGAEVVLGRTTLRVSRSRVGPAPEPRRFGRALTLSPDMMAVFDSLERVAQTDATVVLLGETGCGKEVLAQGIHMASARAGKPFVTFDCGAVAPNLIESDLFGHRRGAFTGADVDRVGAFVAADGGTLFLDEVGELPLDLQPKLLRGLEHGTVKRVGDDAHRKVDVRVIAATHRDLTAEVRAGRFREDLYFRLSVAPIRVPPLRERREDIPLLARQFVLDQQRPEFHLSEKLLARMTAYDWPGNVRELRNLVECALAGLDVTAPEPGAAGAGVRVNSPELQAMPFKEAKEKLLSSFTREYLAGLLAQTGGNVSEVARLAGVARSHIHLLLTRHGLRSG